LVDAEKVDSIVGTVCLQCLHKRLNISLRRLRGQLKFVKSAQQSGMRRACSRQCYDSCTITFQENSSNYHVALLSIPVSAFFAPGGTLIPSQTRLADQFRNAASKRLCNTAEHVDRDVLFAAFKKTDIISVASDDFGKAFLRNSHCRSMPTNGRAKLISVPMLFFFASHG
jgi:hypothetical protein